MEEKFSKCLSHGLETDGNCIRAGPLGDPWKTRIAPQRDNVIKHVTSSAVRNKSESRVLRRSISPTGKKKIRMRVDIGSTTEIFPSVNDYKLTTRNGTNKKKKIYLKNI